MRFFSCHPHNYDTNTCTRLVQYIFKKRRPFLKIYLLSCSYIRSPTQSLYPWHLNNSCLLKSRVVQKSKTVWALYVLWAIPRRSIYYYYIFGFWRCHHFIICIIVYSLLIKCSEINCFGNNDTNTLIYTRKCVSSYSYRRDF